MRSNKSTGFGVFAAAVGLLYLVFVHHGLRGTTCPDKTLVERAHVDKEGSLHVVEDLENVRKQFGKSEKRIVKTDVRRKSPKKKYNVLFMITDDMRPQLGCYSGDDYANPTVQQKMYTPNLDALAGESLLLRRAYTQYSLCGPSRASMMTSRRPDTTRIYGNNLYWRVAGGNYTTLPQFFKEQGYRSVGIGKIYHQFKSSNNQDPTSWSEKHFDPPYSDGHFYNLPAAGYKAVTDKERETVSPLTDDHGMQFAKAKLAELAMEAKSGEQPFFMGYGFMKPHLNFVCPKKYFNMYEVERGEQYLSERSWQMPVVSQYCNMANVTESDGVKQITDEGLRYLRRAYFACISYVDAMVGELVEELRTLGLADSTVVVFVADHGHQLGENGLWGKQTNYDSSTHIPMMIRIPGVTDGGIVSRSIVEAVDLYPTVVEAAGFPPIDACPDSSYDTKLCTEGVSLMPLIDEPTRRMKPAAISQLKIGQDYMAYAIRSERYKFVQYAKVKKARSSGDRDRYSLQWDRAVYWTELYDLLLDPEERVNRTDHDTYAGVRQILETKLHQIVTERDNVPRL